jgi:cell wall-associated NlpC family hydrolase
MNLDRYVGIPWRLRGRDFDGCDCWGIVWLVFKHELGIELPSYTDHYLSVEDKKAIAALIARERSPWREIDKGGERRFDAAILRNDSSHSHIGLITRRGRLLHIFEGRASEVVSYDEGLFKRQIIGFFRHGAHE